MQRDPLPEIRRNHELNTQEILAGRTELSSKPLQINIEVTGLCNIVPPCVYCTGKNFGHNYPHLDVSYLEKYADFLHVCEKINEDSFGEPLSHPGFVDLVKEVVGRGQRFTFVTNGLLLNRRRADELVKCGPSLGIHVSVNAATPDTYFKLHGKEYAQLIDNIVYYVSAYQQAHFGASPDVVLTFIVMRVNKAEVGDFLRLGKRLGVKTLLAPLHNRPSMPLGNFGFDFVYEEQMLSPGEYTQLAADIPDAAVALHRP